MGVKSVTYTNGRLFLATSRAARRKDDVEQQRRECAPMPKETLLRVQHIRAHEIAEIWFA